MPKKRKRRTKMPEVVIMGVLIVQHGAAAVFPDEAHISYPWVEDRCREHWAIVSRRNIVESDIIFKTKDGLNTYKLGFFYGPASRLSTFNSGKMPVLMLGDLDSKWISIEELLSRSIPLLSPGETEYLFSNQKWVARMRELFESCDHSKAGVGGEVVVSLQGGIMKRHEQTKCKE